MTGKPFGTTESRAGVAPTWMVNADASEGRPVSERIDCRQ
jgi:hypothetical protein